MSPNDLDTYYFSTFEFLQGTAGFIYGSRVIDSYGWRPVSKEKRTLYYVLKIIV